LELSGADGSPFNQNQIQDEPFYPTLVDPSDYCVNSNPPGGPSETGIGPTSSVSGGFSTLSKTTHLHRYGYNSFETASPSPIDFEDSPVVASTGKYKSYQQSSSLSISPALTQHATQVYALTIEPYQKHSSMSPIDDNDNDTEILVPSQPTIPQPEDDSSNSDSMNITDVKEEEEAKEEEDNSRGSNGASASSRKQQRNGGTSHNADKGSVAPARLVRKRDKSIGTHIACLFCRRRKIACIAGPSQDRDVGPCM
jgi:hypothetical protein